ncbi:MAG: tRNA (5-methylaminomethyl-2-thiouridylate)-methyltransferase [Legionellales bacterium]|nr:tRNA (5-methylaminomethyl-2-thiouridylate)-methyltransferase [Legionellales bacterium]
MTKQRKAVALISGGLDSMLATKLVMDAGIHVEGINFFTGFCVEGHTHAIRNSDKDKVKRNNALWVAKELGIKLHIIDIVEEYKDIVINPKHGYGANLNPCLDCKVFMVKKAYQWIIDNDFDFIITGEVIGQRPMSQRKATMPIVAEKSGALDRLLRPLCAKNLPETLPEREGWINRESLLDISGRGRSKQIALAKHLNIEDYAQPAGGCCFLTDKAYSDKLKDMWQTRGDKDYTLDDIMLLKVGRHLRPRPNYKLIIARDEGEGNYLEGYKRDFTTIKVTSHPSALILVQGEFTETDALLAAQIAGRYSQGRNAAEVAVTIKMLSGEELNLQVAPMAAKNVLEEWYV